MPTMRFDASRTVANASSRMSSSLAPFSSFCLNSAVLPRSSASESFCHAGSMALMRSTRGRKRLISRSWEVPKTFLMIPPMGIQLLAIRDEGRSLARVMLCDHHSMDAAAHRKIALDAHLARRDRGHQVVQYAVGHCLVKGPLVAIRPEVKLQRLQLHTFFCGNIRNPNRREVGLTSDGTDACEFRTLETDLVFPLRFRIGKCVERLTRCGGHREVLPRV